MILKLKLLLTFVYHGGKLSIVKYGNQYIYIEIYMRWKRKGFRRERDEK